jgi:uncharacterized Zn finger protein (UPF0148 family)
MPKVNNCEHEETKIETGNWGFHTGKVVCAKCNKFRKWCSTKTATEQAETKKLQKEYIKAYYEKNPHLDKYKTQKMGYAFD